MASTIAHRYNLRPRPLAKTKKIDETVNHALVVVEPPGYERLVTQICPKYLTKDEANEIREEFNRVWVENKQLLWSGTNYHVTKIWAAQQGLQTLTDVMGPLMWEGSERCRKATCSRNWSLYMRGASALFAWRISQGRVTTVLTPPPPHRFHPSGMTNYQDVEEPILKGVLGVSVGKIRMVHPEVPGAESFVYKAWPADHCATFVAKFGEFPNRDWRIVSHKREAQTIWQPIVGGIQPKPLLEGSPRATIHQLQYQSKDNKPKLRTAIVLQNSFIKPKPILMNEARRSTHEPHGFMVLAFLLFVEIVLCFALPFAEFLQNVTAELRHQHQHHHQQSNTAHKKKTKAKTSSCKNSLKATPQPRKGGNRSTSEPKNSQQPGSVNKNTTADPSLTANEIAEILGRELPFSSLKKKQRKKLLRRQNKIAAIHGQAETTMDEATKV